MKLEQDVACGELLSAKENITCGKIRKDRVRLFCAQKKEKCFPRREYMYVKKQGGNNCKAAQKGGHQS